MINKKYGFSFVELLVAITIVMLISIVATASYSSMQTKTTNSKVYSDLRTISNVLLVYAKDTQELPMPDGNLNYYTEDTSYSHDYDNAFGVSGFFSEDTLSKKYINYYPYDEKTNQNYAYGKVKDTLAYEVAGVIYENDVPTSVVMGNWGAEYGPYNLIKEYAGPNFVTDESKKYFPYNPNEKRLVASISNYSGDLLINGEVKTTQEINDLELLAGDTVEVGAGGYAEINISDGSSSILGDKNSVSKITFENINFKDNSSLFTNVKLALDLGSIWVKASKLDSNSEFEVSTVDTVAAVRGTIFGVSADGSNSEVTLIEGKIDVTPNDGIENSTNKSELVVNSGGSPVGVKIVPGTNDYSSLHQTSTGNILDIPDEVSSKAIYGKAGFSENIQLKLSKITTNSAVITLNDVTSGFDTLYLNGESNNYDAAGGMLEYNINGYELTLFLDTKIENTLKLCKDDVCTKSLTIPANEDGLTYEIGSDLGTNLIENNTDSIKLVTLEGEDIDNELENINYKVENIGNYLTRNYLYEDGYSVYGYAPFDKIDDYNLYLDDNSVIEAKFDTDSLDHSDRYKDLIDFGYKKTDMNFYTKKSKSYTGIYLDNVSDEDYLSYYLNSNTSSLNYLNSATDYSSTLDTTNIGIEVGVRGAALLRYDGYYTLFTLGTTSLYLDGEDIKLGSIPLFNENDLTKINSEEDYVFLFIKNLGNIDVKILDYEGNTILEKNITTGSSITFSSLSLGVKYNWGGYSNQWNDIFDYLKIYQLETSSSDGTSVSTEAELYNHTSLIGNTEESIDLSLD